MIKNKRAFTQEEIQFLLKNAHLKARLPGLRVLLAPAQQSSGRLLVITPRHSGNAVKRNKIRRRLRSIFHEERWYNAGCDCVVIVKKEGILTSFEQLQQLLKTAFSSQL